MATVSMINAVYSAGWAPLSVSNTAGQTITINVGTSTGDNISIDWGDGVIEHNLAEGVNHSHVLLGNTTEMAVKSDGGLGAIDSFTAILNINLTGNINEFSLLPNIKILNTGFAVNLIGTISDIPISVEDFFTRSLLTGAISEFSSNIIKVHSNTATGAGFSGMLIDIPANIQTFIIVRSTISGDIGDLKEGLLECNLISHSNITGNITNLPSTLKILKLQTNNITGSIANLKAAIEVVSIHGSNTITGNLESLISTVITELTISGFNLISGNFTNIPASLRQLGIQGSNTINGVLSSSLDALTIFHIGGLNTISGNIQNTRFRDILITGSNTISGDLSLINYFSGVLTRLEITGNNTIGNYASKSYTGLGQTIIRLNPANAVLTPADVDQLLIDADSASLSNFGLILTGPGAVSTAASDAAVSNLISNGGTITLTP